MEISGSKSSSISLYIIHTSDIISRNADLCKRTIRDFFFIYIICWSNILAKIVLPLFTRLLLTYEPQIRWVTGLVPEYHVDKKQVVSLLWQMDLHYKSVSTRTTQSRSLSFKLNHSLKSFRYDILVPTFQLSPYPIGKQLVVFNRTTLKTGVQTSEKKSLERQC